MNRPSNFTSTLFALLMIVSNAGCDSPDTGSADSVPSLAPVDDSGLRWGYLENGAGYLVIQNSAAPMIGGVAIVHGGSGSEDADTQGASHFLEHLLFNGTNERTQEEIYDEMDLAGAYNNASTRNTHVNFMILSATETFWDAFDVQTDMLFGSTLPGDKLEKERGIILEELAKDRDSPSYALNRILELDLFGASGYGLPTLGTKASIESLSRDQIHSFFEENYVPARMTWILIGDVDPDRAIAQLEAKIGSLPGGDRATMAPAGLDLSGETIRRHTAPVPSALLQAVWPGPDPAALDFDRFRARLELLASGSSSPLGRRVLADERVAAYDMTLNEYPGFSTVAVRIEAKDPATLEDLRTNLESWIAEANADPVEADKVDAWIRSNECEEIYLREKPHYYGIMRGDRMAARGLAAFVGMRRGIRAIDAAGLGALPCPLSDPPARISLVTPAPEGTVWEEPSSPRTAAAGTGIPIASVASSPWGAPPERAETTEATAPATRSPAAGVSDANYGGRMMQLENGTLVALFTSPESPVFAAQAFIRERSAREPAGRDGMAELLHQLLGTATASRSKEDFSYQQARIGAELKTADSPYIPYDDFYSVPEYSYVRFKTLDPYAETGLGLLAEMLAEPAFATADFERARDAMVKNVESTSPRDAAGFLREQILDPASAAHVFGTSESLEAITEEELREFQTSYLDPRSFLFVISSGLPAPELEALIRETLGTIPAGSAPLGPEWAATFADLKRKAGGRTEPSLASVRGRIDSLGTAAEEGSWSDLFPTAVISPLPIAEVTVGGEQSWVSLVRVFEAPEESRPAFVLANGILSDRIAQQLREREGLAYSIGSSISRIGPGLWAWTASAGTRPENRSRILDGFQEAIEEFTAKPPTDLEVRKTAASIRGRGLMRRVTRLNAAYYAGSELLLGQELGTRDARELALFEVRSEDLTEAVKTYWSGQDAFVVVAR